MSDDFLTRTVHDAISAERGGVRDRTEVKLYASGLGDLLEVREMKKGKSEPTGCRRKLYLGFFPQHAPPQAKSPSALLNFSVGDAYHDTIRNLLHKRGTLVQAEFPLKAFHPHISGRLDWLVMHPKHGLAVIDGKSESPWAFENKEHPKPGDVAQVMHYLDVTGLEWGALLYFNKANGELNECWFRKSPEVVNEINAQAKALCEKVENDRAFGVFDPPPKPDGVRASAFPCSYCDFAKFCWPKAEPKADAGDLKLKG